MITQISDADGRSYDPETGTRILEEVSGVLGLCESCEASFECRGYTGRYGGVYCETFDEDSVCVKIAHTQKAAVHQAPNVRGAVAYQQAEAALTSLLNAMTTIRMVRAMMVSARAVAVEQFQN